MKSFLKWLAVMAAVLGLTACGLPGAVMRTAGNGVKSLGKLGKLAGPAAAAAL